MCAQHIYKQQKLNPKYFPARKNTKTEENQLQAQSVEIGTRACHGLKYDLKSAVMGQDLM